DFLVAGQTKIDAVDVHGNLPCEEVETASLLSPGIEKIIGDDFEDIDAVQCIEDSGRELRPPTEADAVRHHQLPQPPQPPPPPPHPPPPRAPHLEPPSEPPRWGTKSRMNGNVATGTAPAPNKAVSHSKSLDPPPGRMVVARSRSLENKRRTDARYALP